MGQCVTIQKYFSSYIERTLDPETTRFLESHLSGCTTCSRAVADIRLLTARFEQLQPVKTSERFDQNLRARIVANQPVRNDHTVIKTLSYGFSTAVIIASVYFYMNAEPDAMQNAATPPAVESTQKHEAIQTNRINPTESSKAGLAATSSQDSLKKDLSREEESRDVNLVGR